MGAIKPGERKECPYCETVVLFEKVENLDYSFGDSNRLKLYVVKCPFCLNIVVSKQIFHRNTSGGYKQLDEGIIMPLSTGRAPVPKEVPDNIANDYTEACLVFPFSAKASAALARRCLQSILTEEANTNSKNLSGQIDEVLDDLPTYISKSLDAIREIGNFAAHQQKSTETGLILDVEPGEAEWTLDILELLFDHYYVSPAKEEIRRNKFSEKLEESGRNPLKQPSTNCE